MYVTQYVDTNSLLLAALIANHTSTPDLRLAQKVLEYVNLLTELVDLYNSPCDATSLSIQEPFEDPLDADRALKDALFPQTDEDHEQARAIINVFRWTVWQRSVMLHFYYVIGVQLSCGYSSTWNAFLSIRGIGELAYVSREEYRSSITDYLCNWALSCSGPAEHRWRWILVECSQDLMGISTAELGDA